MKANSVAFLRRSLVVAAIATSIFLASATPVSATSPTTTPTLKSPEPVCGVVANPAVHIVSSGSTCVIKVAPGTNVRIKMRSGFRWGNPISSSKSVVVTEISRSSFGVNAVTLHAAAGGHALIRDTGTILCPPGRACPDLALLWTLKVIVT